MVNQKKRFLIPKSFDSFAVDFVNESNYIISSRSNGKLSSSHRKSRQSYLGVILYGYNPSFLRSFSDNLSRKLTEKEIDLSVAYIESLDGLSEDDLCNSGFYLFDVGWFVKEDWFITPNFTLIGNPY